MANNAIKYFPMVFSEPLGVSGKRAVTKIEYSFTTPAVNNHYKTLVYKRTLQNSRADILRVAEISTGPYPEAETPITPDEPDDSTVVQGYSE